MFAHRIVDFTGPDDVQWAEVDEPAVGGGMLVGPQEVIAVGSDGDHATTTITVS